MRVRFTRDMGRYTRGDTATISDDLARRAIRLNRAERVETATRRAPENAASRTRRPEEEPGVCGAATASGGTCQREVTSGDRCWQHTETRREQ